MKSLRLVCLFGLLAATACNAPALGNLKNIGKESDPTRFYTLVATAQGDDSAAMPSLTLGVGPVTVADYLDRSQIVVRESKTQLQLADFDRWAGNPGKEFQRVLGANLAQLLGTQRVVGHPWKSSIAPDMTVEVALERFEYGGDGKVWLVASWQVFADNGRIATAFRRSSLSKDSGSGYADISANLSELTGELSGEIAQAIRTGYRNTAQNNAPH